MTRQKRTCAAPRIKLRMMPQFRTTWANSMPAPTASSWQQRHRETLGASGAQPEIFNCFMFGVKIFCVEAKKSASIQTHQRLGALRIGTLRDHESVAAASYFRSRSFALCRPQSQAAESIGEQMPLIAPNRMLKKLGGLSHYTQLRRLMSK